MYQNPGTEDEIVEFYEIEEDWTDVDQPIPGAGYMAFAWAPPAGSFVLYIYCLYL